LADAIALFKWNAIVALVIDFLLMRSPAKLPKTSQHLP